MNVKILNKFLFIVLSFPIFIIGCCGCFGCGDKEKNKNLNPESKEYLNDDKLNDEEEYIDVFLNNGESQIQETFDEFLKKFKEIKGKKFFVEGSGEDGWEEKIKSLIGNEKKIIIAYEYDENNVSEEKELKEINEKALEETSTKCRSSKEQNLEITREQLLQFKKISCYYRDFKKFQEELKNEKGEKILGGATIFYRKTNMMHCYDEKMYTFALYDIDTLYEDFRPKIENSEKKEKENGNNEKTIEKEKEEFLDSSIIENDIPRTITDKKIFTTINKNIPYNNIPGKQAEDHQDSPEEEEIKEIFKEILRHVLLFNSYALSKMELNIEGETGIYSQGVNFLVANFMLLFYKKIKEYLGVEKSNKTAEIKQQIKKFFAKFFVLFFIKQWPCNIFSSEMNLSPYDVILINCLLDKTNDPRRCLVYKNFLANSPKSYVLTYFYKSNGIFNVVYIDENCILNYLVFKTFMELFLEKKDMSLFFELQYAIAVMILDKCKEKINEQNKNSDLTEFFVGACHTFPLTILNGDIDKKKYNYPQKNFYLKRIVSKKRKRSKKHIIPSFFKKFSEEIGNY